MEKYKPGDKITAMCDKCRRPVKATLKASSGPDIRFLLVVCDFCGKKIGSVLSE